MAREAGTQVSSYSNVAHGDATFDMAEQVKSLGEFNKLYATARRY